MRVSLRSGCCCGAEDAEAPLEQSVSVGVSQASTPKAALSSRKTHPCEMCGPVLRDVFRLAEHQGKPSSQKLLRCGACAQRFYFSVNFQQQPEQHTGEKPFRSSVDTLSFRRGYGFHDSGKPFTCTEVQKDFLPGVVRLQQYAIHTGEKPNTISQCRATLQSSKGHYTRGECKEAFCSEHTHVRDQSVQPGSPCFVCSECGKTFRHKSLFAIHQRFHTAERHHELNKCGKLLRQMSTHTAHGKTLTASRQYTCNKCGKSLSHKSVLIHPQRGHKIGRAHV